MKTIYPINHRALSCFHSIEHELIIDPAKNYLFDLDNLGVIQLEGEKSLEFLQGQLTSNLKMVSDVQMMPAAQCNLKGRILSLMDVVLWKTLHLVLENDMLETTINSLSKVALLSRVELNTRPDLVLFGLVHNNTQSPIPDLDFFPQEIGNLSFNQDYCIYNLGNNFYIILAKEQFAEQLKNHFADADLLYGSLTWHTLCLKNKHFSIYPESRGLFLPHRVDLQNTRLISFDKGCYKGQEIIARMHYKSVPKHQLHIVRIQKDIQLFSGQKILEPDHKTEIGELIDYSILGKGEFILAVSILKDYQGKVLLESSDLSVNLIR